MARTFSSPDISGSDHASAKASSSPHADTLPVKLAPMGQCPEPKFAHVELHDTAEMATGAAFMRGVVAAFPYRIHTVPTDNGVASTNRAPTRWDAMVHPFDRVCREHGIEHRLTKPHHPWTNGQAERMNRTVKDATVKVFHYETRESLDAHLQAFLTAYNFAKRLKALRWRTSFQALCDAWTKDPSILKINPHHLIPGPHT